MSSILEALKKLEAEKAAKQARQRSTPSALGRADAEFLAGGGETTAPDPPRFSQGAVLAVVASVLAVAVVGTAVITAGLMTASDDSKQPAEPLRVAAQSLPVQVGQLAGTAAAASAGPAVAAAPAPAQVVTAPPASLPSAPEIAATDTAKDAQIPAPATQSPALPPAPVAPSPPVAKPAVAEAPAVAEKREPEPKTVNDTPPALATAGPVRPVEATESVKEAPAPRLPKTEPTRPTVKREPAASREPYKPDIIAVGSLPPLRRSEREKYGMENIKVNTLRGVSETRPYGQAIINLDKVMIGEVIPDTKVMLIAIDERLGSIGVEVLDTGERFSYP